MGVCITPSFQKPQSVLFFCLASHNTPFPPSDKEKRYRAEFRPPLRDEAPPEIVEVDLLSQERLFSAESLIIFAFFVFPSFDQRGPVSSGEERFSEPHPFFFQCKCWAIPSKTSIISDFSIVPSFSPNSQIPSRRKTLLPFDPLQVSRFPSPPERPLPPLFCFF